MRIKFLMAFVSSAVLLGFASQAGAESQPAPGTFAIQQFVISQSGCPTPLLTGLTLQGVFYWPGPESLGATMRFLHNDATQWHITVVNNLPRSPTTVPGATWGGGLSGFIAPGIAPPTSFTGILSIAGQPPTTMTWIDSNSFVATLNTTTGPAPALLTCQTRSQITGSRTNLNQGPQY